MHSTTISSLYEEYYPECRGKKIQSQRLNGHYKESHGVYFGNITGTQAFRFLRFVLLNRYAPGPDEAYDVSSLNAHDMCAESECGRERTS